MSLEHPSWYNFYDRKLYDELFYHDTDRALTPEEEKFCNTMYHFEEYAYDTEGDV